MHPSSTLIFQNATSIIAYLPKTTISKQMFPTSYGMKCTLVSLGCCNKVPQTRWLKQMHFFLTILEAGSSKIKAPTDLVADGDCLPSLQRENKLFCVSSYKGSNPIMRHEGPTLKPSQRPHLKHPHLGAKAST